MSAPFSVAWRQEMHPPEKLKIERTERDGITVFNLHGTIDQEASFEALEKSEGPIVINFRDVVAIDSCGIRTWVNFIKSVPHRSVSFEQCAPLIVRQMNMIPDFVAHAKVVSAFVCYTCDLCEAEELVLLEEQEFGGIRESMPCDCCGKGSMVFELHPRQYFAFTR